MARRSEFRVVPPRRKAPLTAKRRKPHPQNREVVHTVYGIGTLDYVRLLDNGTYAAVVTFGGVDRTIRLSPDYFITPIAEIMKLAPHLAPPPKPPAEVSTGVRTKASAVPDEGDEEGEAESAEAREDDTGLSEPHGCDL
jgi:hypothetical protein